MKRMVTARWARAVAAAVIAVMAWMISPMSALGATRPPARAPAPRPRRQAPLRVLGDNEMTRLRGAGYRMDILAGRQPWWEFEKDVNVTGVGNLVKSYTDLSLPGRGLNVDFVRTYNSLDSRVGPFGIGWTHSYDISLVDDDDDPTTVSRTTRSGTRLFYQRNADGLYTSPPFTHDRFTSTYQTIEDTDGSLVSVPIEDKVIAKDGNVYVFGSLALQPDGSPSPVRQIVRINDGHVSKQNPLGNHIDFAYGDSYLDADGHARCELDTITDTVGRVVSLSYTPEHRLASLDWTCDGQPRSVTYDYNDDHNLTAATDPCNRTTHFAYYEPGYVYNEPGVLERITDPAGEETVYTYSVPYVMYWLAVDTVTEPTGLRTYFYYSSVPGWSGMVTWSWQDMNTGEWVGYTGEGTGRFGAECHNDAAYRFIGILTTAPCRQYHWDCANNKIEIEELLGFDHLVTTTMAYDAVCDGDTLVDPGSGRMLSSSSTPDGVQWDTTSYEYESIFPDPTSSTDPNGHVTQCEYDPDTGDPRFQYDARYPETGARTEFRYNDYGQRIELIDPNGHSTYYEYGDSYGNLTAVVDALNRRTEFEYDSVGNLRFKTDAKGQTTEYRYYPDNQVSDVIFDDETSIHYTYDAAGRLATATDQRGMMSFQYDSVGHVTAVTDPVLGAVSYEYYVTGNRKTVSHDGQTTTYYYTTDNSNRVATIVDHAGRRTNYLYDLFGNCEAVIYPNRGWVGGQVDYVAAVATYDRLHRLLTIDSVRALGSDPTGGQLYYGAGDYPVPGGNQLTSRSYAYDPAGNRTSCAMTDPQGSATVQYTYDSVNALTGVDYGGGSTASYLYDPAGNRVQATEDGQVTDCSYDAANQLTAAGDVSFQYDANGNCVTRTEGAQVSGYQWDVRDVLSRVDLPGGTFIEHGYDALGRVVETVSPSGEVTRTLRDETVPLAEYDGNGLLRASYLASDGLLVGREADGAMSCYLHDVQGSVIAFADNDRNIAACYRYGAFGDLRSETGGASNEFRYMGAHGLPTDAAALIHMGMRSYLPAMGRFLSLDPQRQGTNWYRYADNSPVNYIDPSGEWSEENANPWLRVAAGYAFIQMGLHLLWGSLGLLAQAAAFLEMGVPSDLFQLWAVVSFLLPGASAFLTGLGLIVYGQYLIMSSLIEMIDDEW